MWSGLPEHANLWGRSARPAPDEHRRREILDRRADGLEQSNLIACPAPLRAAAERGKVGDDLGPGDDAIGEADRHIAAFRTGGVRVNEDPGAPQRLVVG